MTYEDVVSQASAEVSAWDTHRPDKIVRQTTGEHAKQVRLWNGQQVRKRNSRSKQAQAEIQAAIERVTKSPHGLFLLEVVPMVVDEEDEWDLHVLWSAPGGRGSKVHIGRSPCCDCPEFKRSMDRGTPRVLCRCILTTLLVYMKLPQNSSLLQQVAFTRVEWATITKDTLPLCKNSTPEMDRQWSGVASVAGVGGAGHGAGAGAGAAGRAGSWILERVKGGSGCDCSAKFAKGRNKCNMRLIRGSWRLQTIGRFKGTSNGKSINVDTNFSFCAQETCVRNVVLWEMLPNRVVDSVAWPVRLAPNCAPTEQEAEELNKLGVRWH